MSKLGSLPLLLFVAVSVFVIGTTVPFVQAQTLASTASFSGSVSDSSGARVANANITLSPLRRASHAPLRQMHEGNFSFSLLPAATYALTVQATGFKTFKQEGITLEVGQSATQNVALTIGSTEQIEVIAVAPLLQTDNANVGAEISTKQVTELPLNFAMCSTLWS